jgi:Ca-activated chloride channel homolog
MSVTESAENRFKVRHSVASANKCIPHLMKQSRLLISVTLVCCLSIGALSQKQSDQDDVIRVDTDLTNLLFTASDKQNRFITTLLEEDVRVTEDGMPQKILVFQRETDRPLSIAFLIDVSASEERTLPEEKAAARSFIETVIRSEKDQAAIIPFTGSAFLEQDLTRDVLSIYLALQRVDVAMPAYLGSGRPIGGIASGPGLKAPPREGSTAIWDAIAVTASEVLATDRREKGNGPQTLRRRAIILLTDGFDTSSRLLRSEAIAVALTAETVIYAIGIGDSKYDGVNKDPLSKVAEGTGGRAFFPKRETDLKTAFAEIEKEIRSQYLIAYSSTNKTRDGAYRKMRVELTNPDLQSKRFKLRYRPGYYARPLPAGSR